MADSPIGRWQPPPNDYPATELLPYPYGYQPCYPPDLLGCYSTHGIDTPESTLDGDAWMPEIELPAGAVPPLLLLPLLLATLRLLAFLAVGAAFFSAAAAQCLQCYPLNYCCCC